MFVDIVRSLGHEPLEAATGEAALEVVEEHPDIELVLLDREMPGISGIEFLTAFRAQERFAETPDVMVSSWAEPHWIIEALNAGAVDFLSEPFAPEVLSTRIARYAQMDRAGRRPAAFSAPRP